MVKRVNNTLSGRQVSGLCVCVFVYLLQEGELLGYVLRTVFILAEGESLLTLQADVGEVIHHGAIERHRQGCSDGEGLLFRPGRRGLHYSGESPLKGRERERERDVTGEDTCSELCKHTVNTALVEGILFGNTCRLLFFNSSGQGINK